MVSFEPDKRHSDMRGGIVQHTPPTARQDNLRDVTLWAREEWPSARATPSRQHGLSRKVSRPAEWAQRRFLCPNPRKIPANETHPEAPGLSRRSRRKRLG
jgi:hypothetical protein